VKAPIAPPPGVDANQGFDRDSDGPGPVPLPVGEPHATPTDESDEVAGPPNHISDDAVAPEILAYCRDTVSAREAAQTVTNEDADRADQAFICKMIIAKAQGDLPPGDYTDAQLADTLNRADTGSEALGR
jgi:hypothetical protein